MARSRKTKKRVLKTTTTPELNYDQPMSLSYRGDNLGRAVLKATGEVPASQQLGEDKFQDVIDRVMSPPVDIERLWMLYEESSVHQACIDAKVTDSVGHGWELQPKVPREEAEPPEGEEPDEPGEPGEEGAPSPESEETQEEAQEAQEIATRQRQLSDKLEEITPELTFAELLRQAAKEQEATGNAYWEVLRADNGARTEGADLPEIAALYPMPAHTVRVGKTKDTYLQSRGVKKVWFKRFGCRKNIHKETGQEAKNDAEAKRWADADKLACEVLHFRSYSVRSRHYGCPDWMSVVPAIAELVAIREYNISWFNSGGMTDRSVHVTAKKEDAAKEVAKRIEKQMEEARGRGHVTLITYGTEDVSIQIEEFTKGKTGGREGQFRGRREDLTKEVLMGHSVPPYRVGWAELGSLGGSAAKEMLRAYREGAIEPIQNLFEDRLAQTLFGEDGFNLGPLKWKLKELTWDVMQMNIELATKGVEKGILSPNEGREVVGKPPKTGKPELDDHYIGGTKLGSSEEGGGFGEPFGEPGANPAEPDQSATELVEQFSEALRTAMTMEQ